MKGIFLSLMGGNSSQPKLKKYREMKDMSQEDMKKWLYENFKLDDIADLCAAYILDELNTEEPPKIYITQEQFNQFFRVRKPQLNPARLRKQMMDEIREGLKKELGDGTDDKTGK